MKTNLPFRLLNLGLAVSLMAGPTFSHAAPNVFRDKGVSIHSMADLTIDMKAVGSPANIEKIRNYILDNRSALGLDGKGELIVLVKDIIKRDGLTSVRLQQHARINRKLVSNADTTTEKQKLARIEISGAMATALFDEGGNLVSLDSGLVRPPEPVEPGEKSLVLQMDQEEKLANTPADGPAPDREESAQFATLYKMFYDFFKVSSSERQLRRAMKSDDSQISDSSFMKTIKTIINVQSPKILTVKGKILKTDEAYDYLFNEEKGTHFYHFMMQLNKRSLLRMFISLRKQNRATTVMQKDANGNMQTVIRLTYPFDVPVQVDIDATAEKLKVLRVLTLLEHATEPIKVKVEKPGLLWPQVPGKVFYPESEKQPVRGQILVDTPIEQKDLIDAKDAHDNIRIANDFFLTKFNWDSYDNRHSNIRAVVSVTMEGLKENAAWAGSPLNFFLFGSGGTTLYNLPKAIDVIGHEYFHAIISATSALDHSDQSGALNEHAADVFGVAVQRSRDGRVDWQIGENVLTPSAVAQKGKHSLRNMLNPKESWSDQPENMGEIRAKFTAMSGLPTCLTATKDNDNCLVHYQAGVPNSAIAYGVESMAKATGKDSGTVFDSMSRVLFNVFTMRLRSSSNFEDYAREAVAECNRQIGKLEGINSQSCPVLKASFQRVGIGGSPSDNGGINSSTSSGSSASSSGSSAADDADKFIRDFCKELKAKGSTIPELCNKYL